MFEAQGADCADETECVKLRVRTVPVILCVSTNVSGRGSFDGLISQENQNLRYSLWF